MHTSGDVKRQKFTEYHANFASNLARSTSQFLYKKKKKKKKNGTEATTTFESLVNLALKCKYVYKHTSCTCWKFSGERDFFSHIQLSNHSIRHLVTRAVHNYGVLLINCIAYTKHKLQALLLQVFCCLFLSTDPHRQRVLPNSMELQS